MALSVGRIDPEKNPLLLADALAALRDRDTRWRFVICGEGTMGARIARPGCGTGPERLDRLSRLRRPRCGFARPLQNRKRRSSRLMDRGGSPDPVRGIRRMHSRGRNRRRWNWRGGRGRCPPHPPGRSTGSRRCACADRCGPSPETTPRRGGGCDRAQPRHPFRQETHRVAEFLSADR